MLDFTIEREVFKREFGFLGAIDEAGRGPLAGPVVAACVVCSSDFNAKNKELENIKDSKKLSEKQREKLFAVIFNYFEEVGVGICDHRTIDKIDILQATFLAMKKAIGALKQKPKFIILDGRQAIPNLSLRQKAIINGDNLSLSIAAASIVAKVTRDRIMRQADKKYPEYGFAQHKGYGTKLHLVNLEKYGPCEIHRTSFAPVKRLISAC